VTLDDARDLALALPETNEEDHHGMPSFRVRGKIFATVPDDRHVRVMVDEDEIRAVVAEHPQVCQPMFWGERLACVVVDLDGARRHLLRELLTEAWLRKAPKRLAQSLPRA
jgi:hypothetical protein